LGYLHDFVESMGQWVSFNGFVSLLGYLTLLSLGLYLVPLFIVYILPEQDLKKKYNAQWAFVSGGSSGLGRALVWKCASQGLNVVICALDDDLLKNTFQEAQRTFPNSEFRAIGVNLGAIDPKVYMGPIESATKDIPIQIVFSNAGYIFMRAYMKTKIEALMTNFSCNVVSHIQISHFFMSRMQRDHLKGSVFFTSSQAAFLPAPANGLYSPGKAALTALAPVLAIEGAIYGIDVGVIQAGPMNTRFQDNMTPLDMVKSIYTQASTPEAVTSVIFRTVGRIPVRDHSLMTIIIRLFLNLINVNWFTRMLSTLLPLTADYKKYPDLY
jgi:short-subunit dehydrogenase